MKDTMQKAQGQASADLRSLPKAPTRIHGLDEVPERGLSSETALERLEAALASLKAARHELTLFVSGASAASARAIINARALCDGHLGGRYELTIVDVNQNPELARGSRVLATPTLLKAKPAPERMVVGDLSDLDRVLAALDLLAAESSTGRAA